MMGRVFLGKAWHWMIIAAAAGLLWFCGSKRLHVIEFNTFVIVMLAGTSLAVVSILWFHRPGDQVTRDRLVSTDDSEAEPSRD